MRPVKEILHYFRKTIGDFFEKEQIKQYLESMARFELRFKAPRYNSEKAIKIFAPDFHLQPLRIYEFNHMQSTGASTLAMNISLG